MCPHSGDRRGHAGVVLPIRSFVLGKARLAADLDDAARADLGRRLAERVADAARPFSVVVVTSAPEVRTWAEGRGLAVLDDPGSLDEAARRGQRHFAAAGVGRVVIAHADLPRARSLAALARDASRPVVALVPCHRDDGTNVLAVPADVAFGFSYGPGSFRRHVSETRRLGLGVRVVRDPDLAFDVDVPEDLVALGAGCSA
ncbi:MAG TPA: 2-phospho-L-lactate guanylyltransferase [Acidimicrobiia bacterium]|nr:2-phospho-L-lactate guanylyltransferase [Acidimicrobiia bacterium]